jgi:EmrB/QacA subfamily drug resistance transporter
MAQTTPFDTPGTPHSSGQSFDAPLPRRWWALAATCFGLFMALLDVTIVNVALPTIGDDLNASFADLQWIINAYALALAVLYVTAGRLGDIFGRKRIFMLGLGLFSLGSLLCALAGSIQLGTLAPIDVLIGARALQGIGGSIMLPLSLAIISNTFHGRERGAAIGIYGGVTGLAAAIGPLVGGFLVAKVSWQSIFYINVPIGAVGILLTAWAVRESRDEQAPRSVDVFGLVTLTVALFCLVLALIQANDADKGWTSPYILMLFAISTIALIVFVVGELRLRNPMVDPRIFLIPSYTGAAIVAFAISAGLFSLFFFLTLYLQNFLGFSALDAGIRFLPLSGLVLVTAPLAGVLTHRLGARPILFVGMAVLTIAVLLMTRISPNDTQTDWLVLLPAFVLGGLGSGLVNPPIADVAVGTLPRERAGMASGVNGVCRQLGIAFGIALLGAVLSSQYNSAIHDKVSALQFDHLPAAQQASIKQSIIQGIQQAGTFAGSTGFRHLPPQYAQFANQPNFPAIQQIVQQAFIDGLVDILRIAAVILAVGALAALLLVRKRDMLEHAPGEEPVASVGG